MKNNKYSIRDLKRDFSNEDKCLDFIFDTLHSRKCSCGGAYNKLQGRKQYQCSKCRFQIAPTAGTIFHKSKTPLSLWFYSLFVFSNAKSGISSKELERQLGVTYKCAYRILAQIRKALKQNTTKLKGDVEIDTGYFGGKGYGGEYNKNQSKVMSQKAIVTVAVERFGQIRAEIVPDSKAVTMHDFIQRNVESKTTSIITDGSPVFLSSEKTHDRYSVNHSKREFVCGDIHINTVETFFAHLKRSIKGTHKVLSKKHLQSYLDAFVFHYNNRHNDKQRFEVLLGSVLRGAR